MALKGLKVLEFAGLAPAPFCGMVLADFGATIIRVDRINSVTELDCLGNGKLSIALNLKDPKATKIVRELVTKSDVLLEPYRKGVMEKMGLGPDELCRENPRLIYARLTGYGQNGPYSAMAGHDINYLALSGLLSMIGRASDRPMFPVNLAADFGGGGLMCTVGILMALLERSRSGLGQVVDNSMVEGTAYLGSWLYRSQNTPGLWGQPRGQNFLDGGAHFYDTYRTKDNKFMSVGALEPQFYNTLMEKLGLDPNEIGHGDSDLGREVLTKTFAEKTQQEWCAIFDGSDACVAPVLEHAEVDQHVHNIANRTFQRNGDNIVIPNPAPRLSRTPANTKAMDVLPAVGQHSKQILERLGYENDAIAQLVEEQVVKIHNVSKL